MSANVLFSGDGWRMLTMAEATYLLATRTNATSLQGYATVNGIQGAIILPDNWVLPEGMTFKPKSTTGYNANVYDVTQWTTMENAGAVFLPNSGYRNGTIIQNNPNYGYYWLSTLNGTNAYKIQIQNNNITYNAAQNSALGCFIRLVKETSNGYYFSVSEEVTITFASGNLQYQASTNSWKFADNQYSIVGDNNTKASPTYNGWIDLFGWGTTGWENGRISAQPYSVSTTATDYCISRQSAVGVMQYQDFGIYLCYLRDREENPNKFVWVRNPTLINGKSTLYVSKRGSDTLGDGSAEYPYASLAYVTNVGAENANIMIDDGEWNEARTANNRAFNLWGNGKVMLCEDFGIYWTEKLYYIIINKAYTISASDSLKLYHCMVYNLLGRAYAVDMMEAHNCILIKRFNTINYNSGDYLHNCVLIDFNKAGANSVAKNCIIIGSWGNQNGNSNNNYTSSTIPSNATNSINDAITGQTIADYFNYIHPNVLANPSTATIDELLQCDFTAKAGSANIGAGEKGTTIGLNQGYTMYADNSSNDMFKESNGAVLKNVQYNSSLNGYTLIQKECIAKGGTSSTIILDDDASSVDDYYNNLFVGIVGGEGYGEMFLIIDYNGATHTATIDGTWTTTPTTSSVYTISGTIQSAIKDFGKVIKVKRNWLFADMTPLNDGRWSEFFTHVTSDGKQFPVNSYSYEYSIDGTNWYQGETDYDLISATDGENKVYNNVYGDCSSDFNEEEARRIIMRYIKMTIHIGFNIGEEDVE